MTKEYEQSKPVDLTSLDRLSDNLTLGKQTHYESQYNPELLQAVPRSLNRAELGLGQDSAAALPFVGEDLWTGYELSWLNAKGKPVVAIAEFYIPITSPNLIESKSFKLYLNSFNQTRLVNNNEVINKLSTDLSNCAGAPIKVMLFDVTDDSHSQVSALPGLNIDNLDIEVSEYKLSPEILSLKTMPSSQGKNKTNEAEVSETLNSHLLKSNCLITEQPDWASIVISYTGSAMDHESLLKYLISFRMHNEFHEQCVERIFTDIMKYCSPNSLSVYARYTRRGGLDINPFRSTDINRIPDKIRTNRQ